MAGQQVREFTVRAAGADRSFQKFVLGKFPLGPPELRAPGASWQKHERDCYVAKLDRCGRWELIVGALGRPVVPGCAPTASRAAPSALLPAVQPCRPEDYKQRTREHSQVHPRSSSSLPYFSSSRVSTKEPDAPSGSGRQWVLHDRADKAVQPLLVGQPEAGMGDGGSGAGYFLLVKHTGKEERDTFLALPVTEWQNFKPVSQRQTARCVAARALGAGHVVVVGGGSSGAGWPGNSCRHMAAVFPSGGALWAEPGR